MGKPLAPMTLTSFRSGTDSQWRANPGPKPVNRARKFPEKNCMKRWVEKLIEQFDFDWSDKAANTETAALNEDRATILFIVDVFNKHLLEFEGHPVRKTREVLDDYAKELLKAEGDDVERVLFRLRQFISSYRIDETAYFHKTFEDFRTIIWDFVDQLSEDIGEEQKEDSEVRMTLDSLKEAVESNSIDTLKDRSRKFIDCYVEKQFKRDKRRSTRMKTIRKSLSNVKKQLNEANDSARIDHLTGALNRKSFEEIAHEQAKLLKVAGSPSGMLLLDIDFFKRINDTHGHPMGDFVLKELVKTLKSIFSGEGQSIARIGGEEFAVILPDFALEAAQAKAEEVLQRVRNETYLHDAHQIRFTVSIGIASLQADETPASWIKRADLALYNSKNTGRNRATVAPATVLRAA